MILKAITSANKGLYGCWLMGRASYIYSRSHGIAWHSALGGGIKCSWDHSAYLRGWTWRRARDMWSFFWFFPMLLAVVLAVTFSRIGFGHKGAALELTEIWADD